MFSHFALIGRPAVVFHVVRRFMMHDFIDCVHGHTLDGKLQTTARVADITWITES